MERPLPDADLNDAAARARDVLQELRGARLFVTGGTGFFGRWLIETFLRADALLGLGVRAVVLTRDPAAFRARRPDLAAAPRLSFAAGDVRDFVFPSGDFTHVVHAATSASAALERERPDEMRDVIVRGTARVLDFARARGVRRLLLASSGAVYGRQNPEVEHVAEDDPGLSSPLAPARAYASGKREAERLCVEASERGLPCAIARGFAFLGPGLPLDVHYAAGNFLRDALAGGPIRVAGDGTPYRSYLYPSDLAVWLWTILLRGAPGRAYNVGSERPVSIAELARLTAALVSPGAEIHFAKKPDPGAPAERYVPSVRRAREELGLRETVSLEDAVRSTAEWARNERLGDARASVD
ncbi:MAG: NAD(P)-dependent oxidoreductase [Elusimicrobia bacterium]|nr:NAD(P)-dependent oxidoreductase [Elusimicrobiota bacterium]